MSIVMNKVKVAITLPCTSKGRDNWQNMKDTYLYNYSVKTFLLTMDKQNEYHFYIGYDNDDRLFSKENEQEYLHRISKAFSNVSFHFVTLDVEKGFVTKMWNILFRKAYDDGCEYFFQCGDDINFKTKGWVNDSICALQNNDDIGISGPINNNNRILTQAMFSRKHMDIFGFMFPEEIKNWCCDDWYNLIYKPDNFFPLSNHFCSNDGGRPRYDIDGDKTFLTSNTQVKLQKLRHDTERLAHYHKALIKNYVG